MKWADIDRQPSLLDAASRASDPHTSHAAAAATNGRGAVTAVLRALDAYGPLHADGICEIIEPQGYRSPTYKSAISRAIAAGLAEATGETQLSFLGRGQRVVRITAAGRALLRG